MIDIRELGANQIDALREVANIGAGHAATALSQMTDARINVSVPRLQIARLDEISELIFDGESMVTAVMMHVLGDLSGRTLLVLPRDSGAHLSEILLRRERGSLTVFGELEKSALKEAGNILCAAYLNALSDFLGLVLLPSVPKLVIDDCAAVLTTVYSDLASEQDYVFSLETEFTVENGEPVGGHFLLLPNGESLQVILRTIRMA
jgi:chemotaxis protein CheC